MSAPAPETDWSQWFEALRLRAQAALEAVPAPDKKDLRFRFSPPEVLEPLPKAAPDAPEPDASACETARARARFVRQPTAQLVFLDGHLIDETPLPPDWAQHGACFMPLSRAMKAHPELVVPLLHQSVQNLGSDNALYWHRAAAPEGVFLRVPKDTSIPKTLSVVHFVSGASAVRPHALCLLEENASAALVESFLSLDDGAALLGAESETFVGRGARFSRRSIQFLNTQTRAVRKESALLGESAEFNALSLLLGARVDRHESIVRLAGAGASARLFSAAVAAAGQCHDQRTFQDHLAPDTHSDLLYKNVVFGGGKTVFSGMIDVKPKAQRTAAYQANRNLLMADDAKAYTLPGLEIGANDVACSHGATVGPVDDEALFYMRSRGIPTAQARALLAEGFLSDALYKAHAADLRELCAAMLATKLEGAPL